MVLPPIELRAAEVSHLVSTGLLKPDQRADKLAVLHALYAKMDRVFAQADNKDVE